MVNWPGKESFQETLADLSKDGPARRAFARRMAQALIDEDLELLAKLSSKEPYALLSRSSNDKDDHSFPIKELRVKDAAFSFEAGLVWATAAGERLAKARYKNRLKDYLKPLLNSGLDSRRHALAFICGALQSAKAPKDLKEWLLQTGAESHWNSREFGAPELQIWGSEWTRQAQEKETLPLWCATVLTQTLDRHWNGAPNEAAEILKFARELGEPCSGWLSGALANAKTALDEESEQYQRSAERRYSIGHARTLAKERRQKRQEEWEAMAIQMCSEGPETWQRQALSVSTPAEFRARLEKACLDQAMGPKSSTAANPASPRL